MRISHFLKRDNNNLDLIRLILACLVIVGHLPILNGDDKLWIDPIGHFFTFTYSAAWSVKLFFFISGLLVTNSLLSKKSVTQFLLSRIFRIIPALFFVLIITTFIIGPLVTAVSVSTYFSNLGHLKYIFNNLLFKTDYYLPGVFSNNLYKDVVNGSLWSLSYEVECYIALLGSFLILQHQKPVYWKYVVLIILADTILPYKFIVGWLGKNPDIYLLPAIFSFGALLAVYADHVEANWKMASGLFLLFFILKNSDFVHITFILASCLLLIPIASNKWILKFKLRYDLSYGVYLWGFLVQQTLYHYWGHISAALHCLVALIISIILAFITHIWIEKPFMEFGRYVYDRVKTSMLFNKA